MNKIPPIGTTKGPGETAHEYVFITPDRERTAKVGVKAKRLKAALDENYLLKVLSG